MWVNFTILHKRDINTICSHNQWQKNLNTHCNIMNQICCKELKVLVNKENDCEVWWMKKLYSSRVWSLKISHIYLDHLHSKSASLTNTFHTSHMLSRFSWTKVPIVRKLAVKALRYVAVVVSGVWRSLQILLLDQGLDALLDHADGGSECTIVLGQDL